MPNNLCQKLMLLLSPWSLTKAMVTKQPNQKSSNLILCILISFAWVSPLNAEKVPYKQLLSIAGDFYVEKVTIEGVVDGWATGMSIPDAIKLNISGSSYCGKQFLTKKDNNILKFFFLSRIYGGLLSKGCHHSIEYIWAPDNKKFIEGQVKTQTLKIGPMIKYESGNRFEKFFLVSASVTTNQGVFPRGTGQGYYSTYSDIRVSLDKDWVSVVLLNN